MKLPNHVKKQNIQAKLDWMRAMMNEGYTMTSKKDAAYIPALAHYHSILAAVFEVLDLLAKEEE